MFDHYYTGANQPDDLSWIDDMHKRLMDKGIDALSTYKKDLLQTYRCSCCGEDFIHEPESTETEVNIPEETFFCSWECKSEYNS